MASILGDEALRSLLLEDAPHGDLTTDSTDIAHRDARIRFCARRDMCVACIEEAACLFELHGAHVELAAASGQHVAAGDRLLEARGSAAGLFIVWKTAQTLIEHYSGMATRAAALVHAVRETGSAAAIACTRKNLPGNRALSIKSVRSAGMIAHRLGLSETLLVTPEHQRFLGGEPSVWLQSLKMRCPEKRIVVEVLDAEAGLACAKAGADVIQLEKFAAKDVASFVADVRSAVPGIRIAAAGGIDERNIADYARSGADILVSSAAFAAPPVDVKVELLPDESSPYCRK